MIEVLRLAVVLDSVPNLVSFFFSSHPFFSSLFYSMLYIFIKHVILSLTIHIIVLKARNLNRSYLATIFVSQQSFK